MRGNLRLHNHHSSISSNNNNFEAVDNASLTPATAHGSASKISFNRLQGLNKKMLVFDHLDNYKNIHEEYEMGDVLGTGAYGEVR